jgi:hypothetical protein
VRPRGGTFRPSRDRESCPEECLAEPA